MPERRSYDVFAYLINSDFDDVMLLHHLGCQSAQRWIMRPKCQIEYAK